MRLHVSKMVQRAVGTRCSRRGRILVHARWEQQLRRRRGGRILLLCSRISLLCRSMQRQHHDRGGTCWTSASCAAGMRVDGAALNVS